MIQIVQPDYKIYILIEDEKVIGFDWGEILQHKPEIKIEQVEKQFVKYLKQAIKMVNINEKRRRPHERTR